MKIINRVIPQLAISIILLCCLLKVPFAYYQFTRISVFCLLCYLGYIYYQEKKMLLLIPIILCVILFNPLVKIAFKKHLWQKIDLVIGIIFIAWALAEIAFYFWHKKKRIVKEASNIPHSPLSDNTLNYQATKAIWSRYLKRTEEPTLPMPKIMQPQNQNPKNKMNNDNYLNSLTPEEKVKRMKQIKVLLKLQEMKNTTQHAGQKQNQNTILNLPPTIPKLPT